MGKTNIANCKLQIANCKLHRVLQFAICNLQFAICNFFCAALVVGAHLGSGLSAGADSPGSAPGSPPTYHQAPGPTGGVPGLTPAGPSPLRPDVQVYFIDLPTALRLANTSNPTIGVALARVNEAYARWR